jgi:hypothetical protein
MPTARELLEQADALMRRNRAPGQEADIPELTDEIAVAATGAPSRAIMVSRSTPQKRHSRDDDVPELNDAVEELSLHPLPDDQGEVSRWLENDLGESSITGPAPDSIAVVPPSTLRTPPPKVETPLNAVPESPVPIAPTPAATLVAQVTETLSSVSAEPPPVSDPGFDAMLSAEPAKAAVERDLSPVASAPSPAAPPSVHGESTAPVPIAETVPPVTPDEQQWEGLTEEIRMQVLQRIDIFTDTGLQGELAARLQPIVDRASADLVTTINREVGQILRAYVAEAIEREIETWRESNP